MSTVLTASRSSRCAWPVLKHMDALLLRRRKRNLVARFPSTLFLVAAAFGAVHARWVKALPSLASHVWTVAVVIHSGLHSRTWTLPECQDMLSGAGDPAGNGTGPLPQGADWRSVVQGDEQYPNKW